jgi:hypothetical protein
MRVKDISNIFVVATLLSDHNILAAASKPYTLGL